MKNIIAPIKEKTLWLSRFAKDENGATAVEYGLFVAAIAAVIVAVVIAVGDKVNTAFTTVKNSFP